ncbi:hypothetical protein SNE40_017800 [Patella caerulea]|uniref:galactosylceramidase n=1 Tax=Patella caerulea TaxID=87958 RepID=A0AAN8JEJ0_PATCE
MEGNVLSVFYFACLCSMSFGYPTYPVDNSVGYGRTFTGIGAISGGGATSKLLRNYPLQQRSEILDYLFKPNFGASLHIFKVEIGGDIQSTEGTEASHMHNSWDENYNRGYEWWMMKEAKMRNPDIQLYALPWGFPGFLKDAYDRPWGNIQSTADYVVKWVNGARVYHNLTMDYIGIWNESPYNITYIKTLRKTLDSAGFTKTKIIASDQNGWDIAGDMNKDAELKNAIYGLGSHYPGTNSTPEAASLNKPLWASEDWGCPDEITGPGCLARTLNQNYVNGHMTTTVIWNLISSYYYGLPWYNSGIMTASEPWSGHYVVPANVWVTAHTTQFTAIGWKYLSHGNGVGKLASGGSYVALMSPDEQDITIIIETLEHDFSICTRPPLAPFDVNDQSALFELKGVLGQKFKYLNTWYSRMAANGMPPTLFQQRNPTKVNNGSVYLYLGRDEVWTLTTLQTGFKGSYPNIPYSRPFPLPYIEDFEDYEVGAEPFNLAQQVGAFEVDEVNGIKFMKQVVLEEPVHWFWCKIDTYNTTLTVIGDYNWKDIRADVSVKLEGQNTTDSVFLSVRTTASGCKANTESGLFLFFFPKERLYVLSADLLRKTVLISGNVTTVTNNWDVISLEARGDHVWGAVNQNILFNITTPISITNGWVGLGSYPYGTAYFDDLHINKV